MKQRGSTKSPGTEDARPAEQWIQTSSCWAVALEPLGENQPEMGDFTGKLSTNGWY